MNGNPTDSQRKFHQWCRDYGCILTSSCNPDIHHIKGSKLKLKGCDKPGEWYIIPINSYWHNYYGDPNSIHRSRSGFCKKWDTTEKELWLKLIELYEKEHDSKPMTEHTFEIIKDRA